MCPNFLQRIHYVVVQLIVYFLTLDLALEDFVEVSPKWLNILNSLFVHLQVIDRQYGLDHVQMTEVSFFHQFSLNKFDASVVCFFGA